MKHNLLKSVILSVILFMGVSNAWAGAGIFYGQVNLSKDGSEYIAHTDNWSNEIQFGSIKSLSLDATYIKVWKEGGNICSAILNYNIWDHANTNTPTYGNTSPVYTSYDKPINDNNKDYQWKKEDINRNLNDLLVPGHTYTIDFWFTATGSQNNTSNCNENFVFSNNSNNYKVTFTYAPYYTVTLGSTSYGEFTVVCNGQEHVVSDQEIKIYNVLVGTPLTIKNIIPHDGYDQTMIYMTGDSYTYLTDYTENNGNRVYTYTVNSDVTIAEDFRTKENQTIYFKVPKKNGEANGIWQNLKIQYFHYVDYQNDGINDVPKHDVTTIVKNDDNYIYYKYDIPAGNHSFKLHTNDNTKSSNVHWYELLPKEGTRTINQNCWSIDNKADNNNASGQWVASKVYLDPNAYCTYGITCDDKETYLNHATEERMIELPYGSSLKIVDAYDISPYYKANPRYATSVVINRGYEANGSLKLYDEIRYSANIVTKYPYTIYLHIPESHKTTWNGADAFKYNTMYLTDYLSGGQIILENQNNKRVAHLLTATKDDILSSRGEGEYWKFEVPAGYNAFIIERKTNGDDDDWGEGKNGHSLCSATPKFYFRSPVDIKNVYSLTRKTGGTSWIGEWKEAPSYTVELGYCEFGEYKVMCNGNIYTSKPPKQNVSFEAPYGSEITFVEGTPLQDIYKGGWMLRKFNGSDKETRLDVTEPYIVTGDILLDDNFVIEDPRICYLAVPKNNLAEWNQNGAGYFIWRHDQVGGFPMIGYSHQGKYFMEDNTYKYYKFTILEGCNKIYFQHKVPKNNPHENNNGNTLAGVSLNTYDIPISDKNCYYLTGETTGYWDYLPIDDDQYRLLYVEQVVEKDKENNTVLTRKKAHPSDIFTKEDITTYTNKDGETLAGKLLSLHVYRDRPYTGISWYDEEGKNHKYYTTKASNAGVILQKTVGGKWVDISNNMVFGRLEGVPEVALLPGRKNAASSYSSVNITNLYDDDGIEPIKIDEHEDKGNGVWNFVVKKDNSGNVYIALDETHRYEGEYYIRTVAAEGGWENYKTIENQMTRSNISKKNSNFSHYFCKWIGQAETDVQFTVANKYGCAISDTLMSDRTDLWEQRLRESKKMVTALTIPASANIRFAWNEKTNFIHRAYLSGSTNVSDRFLVLEGDAKIFDAVDGTPLKAGEDTGSDPRFGLNDNEEIFKDNNNWLYYADVQMKPMAPVTVTAKYANKVQYFVGKETKDTIMLRGSGDKKYLIRMLYDFKTNELISAYVPYNNASNQVDVITTNLMLIRQDNGETKQLSFASTDMKERVDRRSYGVIEFTKARLIDNPSLNPYERSLYWISFPFDVNLQDALSFGTYGTHWIIQEYDGAQRAKDGLWLDSDTFWKYHWNQNITLKANQGYVVALAIDKIKKDGLFDISAGNPIGIYFPSVDYVTNEIINQTNVTTTVPAHKCEINRGTPKGDRTIKDSHWNVIGVPSYANTGADFKGNPVNTLKKGYVYEWLGEPDKYQAIDARKYNFKSLYAYMVQYAGDLDWTTIVQEKGMFSLSARKESDELEKAHYLTLELQQNGQKQDYTFIELQEENVTTAFDFNYDLCKINNKGANIYSLIATDTYPVEVAANVLPIEEAIIPLGVKITAAGEYTFAMPDGTDGIVVELIDYETNTRTNMLLDNYTVNLGKGTFDNRFALHVKPDKTTTSVDNIGNEATGDKVKKYLIDGVLYMQKDGVLYDAQGRKL